MLQFVIDSYDTSSGSGVAKETIVKVFNIAVNKTRSLKDSKSFIRQTISAD